MSAERMPLRGIRAVAIDLDGTLVDTSHDFHVSINLLRAELSLAPLSLIAITRLVGRGAEHLIRQLLAVDFAPAEVEARFADTLARYLHYYRLNNGLHSSTYPGVYEGLAGLQAMGLRMACVTNKPFEFADALLEQRGLREYFEVVYGGDSLPARKPDPLPLLQVCSDFKLAPSALLMIGDSCNDAMAARAAGCPVLMVPYGYNDGEDVHAIDSDGIVATLHAALPALGR